MSEQSVAQELRSHKALVVVEAPAGCGKTFQAATFAIEVALSIYPARVLLLAHTNAACDVFARRCQDRKAKVQIRTIDGLVTEIASMYHSALGVHANAAAWALARTGGFDALAERVALLLRDSSSVASALANRFPIVICDEHQDTSEHQHNIVMSLHRAGAHLRIFGDPMQRIYASGGRRDSSTQQHWADLLQRADCVECLDQPRRWSENPDLGSWILKARESLKNGQQVDLTRELPASVTVIMSEHIRPSRKSFQMDKPERKGLDKILRKNGRVLFLAAQNDTVRALHAFFYRQVGIWEGHSRDHLGTLATGITQNQGDAPKIGLALVDFLAGTAKGFTPSGFGRQLLEEIDNECKKARRGKPSQIQHMARLLLASPDHKGVSDALVHLMSTLRKDPNLWSSVKIDLRQEFWDAVRLRDFDDAEKGLAALHQRRTLLRPAPAEKCLSTIHKAKGLEWEHVVVLPCGADHFNDTGLKRNLLYVALSRAVRSLTIVVPRENASPLLLARANAAAAANR
jgi:AAA domain/UvrD-like helicase C-terminal domain